LITRENAKKAENTSDISTHELSQENYPNSSISIKQFKKSKINDGKKLQETVLWSPCSKICCKLFSVILLILFLV